MLDRIKQEIEASIETKRRLLESASREILLAGKLIADSLQGGGTLFLCGNGGSAADAQHIAAELLIRFKGGNERKAIPALSLSSDPSVVTACGNDYGYDRIFSRQMEGLSRSGDVLTGITTSGNSKNILHAFEVSRSRGVKTILLSGEDGGEIYRNHPELLDVSIRVPSKITARIQESHILVGHILCSLIEKQLFNLD